MLYCCSRSLNKIFIEHKMSNITYDDGPSELQPEDLTNNAFDESFLLSNPPLPDDSFSSNQSLSPCMVSVKRDDSDDDSENDFQNTKATVPPNTAREVYLVTYSRADVVKVQDRKRFAEIVCSEFNRDDDVVQKWVCSAEMHRKEGFHFHLAIKLNTCRRFRQVRLNLKKKHGIDVDFQGWHDNYYSAFTYVTKYDTDYITSPNHPALENPPKTSKATSAKRSCSQTDENPTTTSTTKKRCQKPYKPPRLDGDQLGQIIRKNNIRKVEQLYALAGELEKEGKHDLQSYLYKHPQQKSHVELISLVWNIENAPEKIARNKKSRLEILAEAKAQPCAIHEETGVPCNGEWLKCALETLQRNNISRKLFSELVMKSLKFGRGKGKNLMITGPTNCAKSFMLMPLTKVFKCFSTPANGNFNWTIAPQKEIIFLNDIRYESDGEKKIMPWHMFLNLLEGATVNISMPKNFYADDYEWVEKQPIFATCENPIVRIKNGSLDEGETQQMAQRWVVLKFRHQYLEDANHDITPCGRCFAELLLEA